MSGKRHALADGKRRGERGAYGGEREREGKSVEESEIEEIPTKIFPRDASPAAMSLLSERQREDLYVVLKIY